MNNKSQKYVILGLFVLTIFGLFESLFPSAVSAKYYPESKFDNTEDYIITSQPHNHYYNYNYPQESNFDGAPDYVITYPPAVATTADTTENTSTTTTDENTTNTTQDSYSSLTSSALFGTSHFMPSGLIQWLFLGIFILLIIIIVRKLYGEHHYLEKPLKHA